ncbi:ABC transporter ATP-binding protein [Streptomyces purpurascens]
MTGRIRARSRRGQEAPGQDGTPADAGLPARGLRFLLARRRVLFRLVAWSVLETGHTFLIGYGPARALDEGFLRGRAEVGLIWLAVTGLGVLVGAWGTARVYAAVAALVEPLRDRLVERVVSRGVRTGDTGLSGLTQQVEIARDTFAGLVMVSRSFVFTAAGALAGLFALAPPLLLVVGPPLVAGVALFAATLRPLARRQETFLVADEALAGELGAVCPGLRDITATGAEAHIAAGTGERVEAELRAARALAHWGVLRVASLAIGGQLPIVLLLAAAPWLLAHGVTTGALVGALAYVTQSLLPALRNLVHGLGTSGSRLTVVLRRLVRADTGTPTGKPGPGLPAPEKAEGTPPAFSLTSATFAYGPASAPVVQDLDLTLPAGSHLAVVGPSGTGKSTLTALVAGLLTPDQGSGRGGRTPCPDRRRPPRACSSRRRRTSSTPPWPRTSPTCGRTRCPRKNCWPRPRRSASPRWPAGSAACGARVDPAALSAGERQLIALTRAYLSYAPLALLDEATCHLDPETEERAERAFAARPGGTLVVVAHRISSARRAGRVLVMDGRSTAYGGHEELLRTSALYRDLVGSLAPGPSRRR